MEKVDQDAENSYNKLVKKIDEVELNTLWKIKDYEELLRQRPTIAHVAYTTDESYEKVTKNYKMFINDKLNLSNEEYTCKNMSINKEIE